MKIKHVGWTAALLITGSFLVPNAAHAQQGQGPGGGFPPPPPIRSGSGAPAESGSNNPPPFLGGPGPEGPGGPGGDRGGCGNGGTENLPTGTFEALTIRVTFTPTSGTTTSAHGILQAVGLSGTDNGSIDIRTTGLTTGTYTVTADTSTSSTATTLGTFAVRPAPSTTSTTGSFAGGPPPGWPSNSLFGGRRGIQFPSGFDPFTITSLAISDSNANVLFTASVATIDDGSLVERTPIVSGSSVSATGSVFIRALAIGGTNSGILIIHAKGLPDSATYTYAINGTDEGTLTTGSSGNLNFIGTSNPPQGTPVTTTLPSTLDLLTVSSVTVLDSSNNVIISAGF
jgi:hypothetical protein